ncbi:MAG: DNA polymerase [Promethearchaeota archaeon]|jgi:hypothetical protein
MKEHLKFQALKKRSGNIRKKKKAVFDIEAQKWVDFLLLGFYDGREFKFFYSIESFLKYVLSKRYYGYCIYAHFGGKYDFLFLLDKMYDSAEIVENNGAIVEIKIGFQPYRNRFNQLKYKNYIRFRDSFRLMPTSLKKITETFKVDHLKGEIDFNKIKIDDETKKYLKNDVIGLYESLEKFETEINNLGGEIKLTIASTAMDLFQRKFMKDSWIFQTYPQYDEFVRTGYYGGRSEVFKKHLKDGYYYDINSLYPYVMMINYFPVGSPIFIKEYKYDRTEEGMVEIECHIPKDFNIPLLPQHINNMMLFTTGRIRGIYPMPFLRKLEDLGIDFVCFNALIFGKEKLFENYVNILYNYRLKHKDDEMGFICKILLNSLYGKFAQKVMRKNFFVNPSMTELMEYVKNKDEVFTYNEIKDVWYYETILDLNYILPAISCYVTCYAQLEIYKYLENFPVNYCDTDSIFTTGKIKTSTEIGKLKLEMKIKEAIFLSQKLYAIIDNEGNEKIIAKGFPQSDLKKQGIEFTFNDFENALYNNDYSKFNVAFKSIYGFKEALKRKNQFLFYGNKSKSIQNLDTKRKFVGIESEPFYID